VGLEVKRGFFLGLRTLGRSDHNQVGMGLSVQSMDWLGLARGYAYRCRRTIAMAAIMPKGIRMKRAMRMPIAKPFASGERPGGTATNRVSQSSSFMGSQRVADTIYRYCGLMNPQEAQTLQLHEIVVWTPDGMMGEVIVKDGYGVRIRWEDGQLGYYQFTDLLSQIERLP
jgi:hypothetical protein